jgi:hypothetical protein
MRGTPFNHGRDHGHGAWTAGQNQINPIGNTMINAHICFLSLPSSSRHDLMLIVSPSGASYCVGCWIWSCKGGGKFLTCDVITLPVNSFFPLVMQ